MGFGLVCLRPKFAESPSKSPSSYLIYIFVKSGAGHVGNLVVAIGLKTACVLARCTSDDDSALAPMCERERAALPDNENIL